MPSLDTILPRRTERGLLVGMTGTGKSTLAEKLLPMEGHVLALDPKCMLGGPSGLSNFQMIRDLRSLRWSRKEKIQLRLNPKQDSRDVWDRILWWIWERKNTFVYIDEVNLISPGAFPLSGLRACVTTGRERGIGVLSATQRPTGIPRILRSESEWTYCFHLAEEDQREAVAEAMENDLVVSRPAEGHSFWVHRKGWPVPKLMLLNLEKG